MRCKTLFALLFILLPAIAMATDFHELLTRPVGKPSYKVAYGAAADQFGELWLPERAGPHPVIVMIHGGCWMENLPGVELMAPIADDLRKSGVAVWNLEYRRLGTEGAGYPGTFLDIADGVDYLNVIAEKYDLDLAHVVITGHSAGGHLALWAAARNHLTPVSPLYRDRPLPFKAAVTLAGINDIADYRERGTACGGAATIDALTGVKQRAGVNVFGDTSPAALMPFIPQIVFSGDSDAIVPARFGEAYVKIAEEGKAKSILLTNTGHFEMIDPTSAAWPQIKADLLKSLKLSSPGE